MDKSGSYSYNTIYNIPNSWPKFESAQEANENYGVDAACDNISTDNAITFYENGVYEAYPSWNSYDEVDYYGAGLLSWSGHGPIPTSPNCQWSHYVTDTETDLYWTEGY